MHRKAEEPLIPEVSAATTTPRGAAWDIAGRLDDLRDTS